MPYPGRSTLQPNIAMGSVFNDGTGLVDNPGFVIDYNSVSITSNVPGFINKTLNCPTNRNCRNINTQQCTSFISFTNGGINPPQDYQLRNANVSPYTYSYYISDGRTWSVLNNLTLTIDTTLGFSVSNLGNYYLTVTNITGTRVYSSPLNQPTVVSKVTSIFTGRALTQNIFFPLALSSMLSVYNMNNAPFLDYGGLAYQLTPPSYTVGYNASNIPVDLWDSFAIVWYSIESMKILIDTPNWPGALPVMSLQQQILLPQPPVQ